MDITTKWTIIRCSDRRPVCRRSVFVIRQDYTDVDRILEGMEILSGSGAEITGCILNDVNVRTSESQHYMNSYRTKGETL